MLTSSYTPLVTVDFSHDYWGDQPFRGVRFSPYTMEPGILFRARPGGFTLYFDANFRGRARTRAQVLESAPALLFAVTLQDSYFYNYTDLPLNTFCYWNEYGNAGLHQETTDGAPPPFGILELTLDKDLLPHYAYRFATRSTYWRYVLVGEALAQLENPSIVDPQTKEAFDGPQTVTLRNDRTAVTFISKNPIALTEPAARRFQLLEQGRVVMGMLPTPDVRFISSAIPGSSFAAEILLY